MPQVRRDILATSSRSEVRRLPRLALRHGPRLPRPVDRPVQQRTQPTFSVGEYDWDKQGEQRGWIWCDRHQLDVTGATTSVRPAASSTSARSSPSRTTRASTPHWYGFGNGIGLMGDTTDGQPWKQRAVTFLENHDTGYRTNEDGTPAAGPRAATASPTTGRSSRATPTSSPTPASRACTGSTTSIGARDLAEQDQSAGQRAQGGGRPRRQRLTCRTTPRQAGVYAARVSEARAICTCGWGRRRQTGSPPPPATTTTASTPEATAGRYGWASPAIPTCSRRRATRWTYRRSRPARRSMCRMIG